MSVVIGRVVRRVLELIGYDELGTTRTAVVSRLHRLLLELVVGGAKRFQSVMQARALLATVRPRDLVGKTRRQLAAELIGELAALKKKIKAADQRPEVGRSAR